MFVVLICVLQKNSLCFFNFFFKSECYWWYVLSYLSSDLSLSKMARDVCFFHWIYVNRSSNGWWNVIFSTTTQCKQFLIILLNWTMAIVENEYRPQFVMKYLWNYIHIVMLSYSSGHRQPFCKFNERYGSIGIPCVESYGTK